MWPLRAFFVCFVCFFLCAVLDLEKQDLGLSSSSLTLSGGSQTGYCTSQVFIRDLQCARLSLEPLELKLNKAQTLHSKDTEKIKSKTNTKNAVTE